MSIDAGEGQRIRHMFQGFALIVGGFVGSAGAAADGTPMPAGLVWVCAYDDERVQCFDTHFESPVIVDCGNPRALTAYEGGSGTMIVWDAAGKAHHFAYGSRSYNARGGPGNLDVLRLFPDDGVIFGSKGDFEHCEAHIRP